MKSPVLVSPVRIAKPGSDFSKRPRRAPDARPAALRSIGVWPALRRPLDRYLQGWADADVERILAAAAPDFCFHDPLVGRFTSQTLTTYFERVRERMSRAGTIPPCDVAFFLQGPTDVGSTASELCFFREAPRLGLTGVSAIRLGPRGVQAETVAYDLNLASDLLRRAPSFET